MNKKIVLMDVDGIVIHREGYFSERFAKRQGIPLEKVTPFFKGEFQLCLTGKADLKQEISKYLADWGWNQSLEELLDYWFSGESQKDEKVLGLVDRLRKDGNEFYLVSDNEKYRVRYLREVVGLEKLINGSFYSCEIGFKKSTKEFFTAILEKLNLNAEDVLYWDDDGKNVAIAKELGIDGRLFSSFEDFEKQMSLMFA